MDTANCQRLINRILAYWELEPSTLRCRAWEHALADLDEGRAGTAFKQCTKSKERISPAVFLQVYNDIKTDTNHLPCCPRCEGTARTTTGDDCPNCSGSGYAERPSLPPMSPSQYVKHLNRMAALGNKEAIKELGIWHRAGRAEPSSLAHKIVKVTHPAVLEALDG